MSDQVNKAYQATPTATLEQQIMDPNFPKNEREWWAADRITQLEAALREIGELSALCYNPTVNRFHKIGDVVEAALGEERT